MKLFDDIAKSLEDWEIPKVENNPKLKKYLSNLNDQYNSYKYPYKFQTDYKGYILNLKVFFSNF